MARLPLLLALTLGVGCGDGDGSKDKDKDAGDVPSDGDDGDGNADGAGDGEDGDAAVPDGDGDGDGDGDPDPELESLLPWAEGNTWTYRVTKGGVVSTKVTTVGPEEPVGGTGPNKDTLAFKVTTKKGDSDETVSWQAVVDNKVIRYREIGYGATTGEIKVEEHWAPYKLHIDDDPAHREAGASWVETYEETKITDGMPPVTSAKTDTWMVDSPSEEVTVPAGTFTAVVLRKSNGTDVKTYWYVPGVGKVKETGSQVEELESYELAE